MFDNNNSLFYCRKKDTRELNSYKKKLLRLSQSRSIADSLNRNFVVINVAHKLKRLSAASESMMLATK